MIGQVAVTDENGKRMNVTDNGNGTYSFIQPGSRVMIAVAFVCDGKTSNCPSGTITDLNTTAWYHLSVDYVLENGLMNGYGNGKFGTDDPITREQLAVMFWRYAGCPKAEGTLSGFTDSGKASGYALEALRWALENGIMQDKGGGILDPTGRATRAEVAAMLMRFCETAER